MPSAYSLIKPLHLLTRLGAGLTDTRLVYIAAAFLIAAKWLLVCQNEIVSEPYDAHQYVLIAENVSAGGGGKSIGYPLWLSVSRLSGIPQRLVIEGLWILSSTLFATLLARLSFRRWMFPFGLTILLFAPATLFLFDRALTEGFFICLTLLLATASLALLSARSTRRIMGASVAGGGIAGIMLISRNETPLVTVYLVLLAAVWSVLQRFHHGLAWRAISPRLLIVVMALATATTLPITLVSLQNQRRHGVFTVNLAEMPSHMGMLKRLAAINTGAAGLRFIPISRAARDLAYAASPSLAPFKPFVEDQANVYQAVTHDTYGTTGEIGAGWIWHVFNQTAASVGATSPAATDMLYRRINAELDAAFQDNRLIKRFVPHPFLGSDSSVWVKHLPEGLAHSLRCVATPTAPMQDQDYASDLFDRICLRRHSLIARKTLSLSGWAFTRGPGGSAPISRLLLDFTNGTNLEVPLNRLLRLDVRTGFAGQSIEAPAAAGFQATVVTSQELVGLTFIGGNGVQAQWGYPAAGKGVSLPSLAGETTIEAGLDRLDISRSAWSIGLRGFIIDKLIQIGSSTWAWCAALVGALLALILRSLGSTRPRITPLFAASLVFATWSAGRVLFYAIITAGAWEAEVRYLQPAAVLTLCAILAAWACATELKAVSPKKSAS